MITIQNDVISECYSLPIHLNYQHVLELILSSKPIIDKEFQKNLDTSFQLFNTYEQLCNLLLKENSSKFCIYQLENGAIPSEFNGYHSSNEIAQQPFHAEIAVLLALYGHYSNEKVYLDKAYKAALWQKQLLDCSSLPILGMYTQEKNAIPIKLLTWTYLLFYLVGSFLKNSEFIAIAKKQKKFFCEVNKIPSIILIIEKLFPLNFSEDLFSLDNKIQDSLSRLVGIRNEQYISLSTIVGGKTGLGSLMKSNQLGFITFGPQYLPYGENLNFGIDSSINTPFDIELKEHEYLIQGTARIPGKENNFSFHWLDISQHFHEKQLDLKINFLSLEDCKNLSFIFYVAAEECKIGNQITLKTKSFSKYKGKPALVEFLGNNEKIFLEPIKGSFEMEIIPLGGQDSYWKGDFLVGFYIQSSIKNKWSLILEN